MTAVNHRMYMPFKRFVDLIVSAVLLAVLSPAIAFISWRVKRDGGPVFYCPLRCGQGGRSFRMLKFRTMVVDADRLGGPSTADDDPRLTSTGRLLRRWKLDELPQLLNVLGGDMSLVGPRPQVHAEVDTYTSTERLLLTVRPGMTDWASIKFRNEGEILAGHEDPDLAYERLIRPGKSWLGVIYATNPSLLTDLRIVAKTAFALLGGNPSVPDVPSDAAFRLGLPEYEAVDVPDQIKRKAD